MDFVMALDADAVFVAPVGEEILGSTMGCVQSFSFGQSEHAPFESDPTTSSFIAPGSGKCYYAGGLFGGSYKGFAEILRTTTWLMEWDLAVLGHTASHDDESYLNKVFHLAPPDVSLSANYIFPEPPADRAWGLRGVNWQAAFPPKIHNLGARKWLAQSAVRDRRYEVATDPFSLLLHLGPLEQPTATSHETPRKSAVAHVAIGICAPLTGSWVERKRWLSNLRVSISRWYQDVAEVVVVDTSSLASLEGGEEGIEEVDLDLPVVYEHIFRGSRDRSDWSASHREGTAEKPCPLTALQLLLERVRAARVLLLDTPVLLTWQSYLPLLGAAAANTHVVVCPRFRSAGGRPKPGDCSPSSGDDPVLMESRSQAAIYPPAACGLCDTAEPNLLTRDQEEGSAVELETRLRTFRCWRGDRVRGYHGLLVDVRPLLRALAHDSGKEERAGRCGIDCLVDAVRQESVSAQNGAGRFWGGGGVPDILVCAPDMQQFMRYDIR
jgi:hypothetical protein